MNRCFAAMFGALGTGALVGALFFGATHQWLMVAVCAAMVWALLARPERRKSINLIYKPKMQKKMNRQEYSEQMKDLCRQQAELKIAHMDNLEDLEAQSAKRIAEINEATRVAKREMKAKYHREQLELECKKQSLRADYMMEHPEECKE